QNEGSLPQVHQLVEAHRLRSSVGGATAAALASLTRSRARTAGSVDTADARKTASIGVRADFHGTTTIYAIVTAPKLAGRSAHETSVAVAVAVQEGAAFPFTLAGAGGERGCQPAGQQQGSASGAQGVGHGREFHHGGALTGTMHCLKVPASSSSRLDRD